MTSPNPSAGANLPSKDSFKGYREHRRMISSSSEDSTSSFKSTLSTHPRFVKTQKRTAATPNAPAPSTKAELQSPVKTSSSSPLNAASSSVPVVASKAMPPPVNQRVATSSSKSQGMSPSTSMRASTRNVGTSSMSTPLAMKDPNRTLQTPSVNPTPKPSAKVHGFALPSTGPHQKAVSSSVSSPLASKDGAKVSRPLDSKGIPKPTADPRVHPVASTSVSRSVVPATPIRDAGRHVAPSSTMTPLAARDTNKILTPATNAKSAPKLNLKATTSGQSQGLKVETIDSYARDKLADIIHQQSIHAPESARQSRQIERIPTDIALPKQAPKAPIIKPQVKAFDSKAFESQNWMSNLSASKIEADDDDDNRRLHKDSLKVLRPVAETLVEKGQQDEEPSASYAKKQRNPGMRPILKPKSIRVRRDLQEYEKIEMSESYEQEFGVRALEEEDEDEGFEHLSRPPSPVGPRKTYIRGKTASELGLDSTPSTPAVSLHPSDTGSDDSDSHIVPYEDSDDENEGFQAGDDTWQRVPSPERSPKGRLTPYHQRFVSDLDHRRGPIRTTSMGNLIEGSTGDWLQLEKEVDGTLAANKNGAPGRSDPHRRKSMLRVAKNWLTGSNRPRKGDIVGASESASEVSSCVSSTVKTAPVTKPEKQKILRAQEARGIIRGDREQRLAAERSTVFPVRNTIPGRVTPEEKELYEAMRIETMRRGMLDAARSETRLPPREDVMADARERDLKRRALVDLQKRKEGESKEDYLKRNAQNKTDLFQAAKDRKHQGGMK